MTKREAQLVINLKLLGITISDVNIESQASESFLSFRSNRSVKKVEKLSLDSSATFKIAAKKHEKSKTTYTNISGHGIIITTMHLSDLEDNTFHLFYNKH